MLPFTQVDVFADRLTFGNPVAVVHDADELSTQEMIDFARWTKLSETTFLLRPDHSDADYRLRIFTTARELPFAGHPTLGSARAWLHAGGRPKHEQGIVQQCASGLIQISRDDDQLAFAAPPLLRGGPVSDDDVAELMSTLDLDSDDVIDTQWADNGPGWVALLLRDAQRVLALEPDRSRFTRFQDVGVVGAYPSGASADFEVRAFTAGDASIEDPVTGSLNAALAQWLIPAGYAPATYVASQGTRLGHHGRVQVTQRAATIWVGGHTTVGMHGTVALG